MVVTMDWVESVEIYGEMKPCRCTFAQKLAGDGCEICNPERAKELSEEGDDDE